MPAAHDYLRMLIPDGEAPTRSPGASDGEAVGGNSADSDAVDEAVGEALAQAQAQGKEAAADAAQAEEAAAPSADGADAAAAAAGADSSVKAEAPHVEVPVADPAPGNEDIGDRGAAVAGAAAAEGGVEAAAAAAEEVEPPSPTSPTGAEEPTTPAWSMRGIASDGAHRASWSMECVTSESGAAGAPAANGSPCGETLVQVGTPKSQSGAHRAHVLLTSKVDRVLMFYAERMWRCPLVFVFTYVFFVFILIIALWKPLVLEQDFAVFVKADGDAMRNRDALLDAYAWKKSGSTDVPGAGRRLAVSRYLPKDLTLIYEARGGDAFNEGFLREVRDLEQRLRDLPTWAELCADSMAYGQWLCTRGESFVAYAWPSQTGNATSEWQRFRATFDGRGSLLLPLPAAVAFAQDQFNAGEVAEDPRRFFPKAADVAALAAGDLSATPPTMLRSRFTFLLIFADTSMTAAEENKGRIAANERYAKFLADEVYPLVSSATRTFEHANVYYSGSDLAGYEVSHTLMTDIRWAIGSIVFVTCWMYIHIRSVSITMGSFFVIFASVPVAYVLTPAASTTVASFLSLFLVTVIDIDVIFVFADFWQNGANMLDPRRRLAWATTHAAKSCLATSLTTALSFFANLASCLQPLREFGLFMGLSVVAVYVLTLLIMPPLFIYNEKSRRLAEARESGEDTCLDDAGTLSVLPSQPDIVAKQVTKKKSFMNLRSRRMRCTEATLIALLDQTARCPYVILCLTVLCLPIFLSMVFVYVKLDMDVPQIFPDDHNAIMGPKLMAEFNSVSIVHSTDEPLEAGSACRANAWTSAAPVGTDACLFHWCDMNASAVTQDNDYTAQCDRSPTIVGGAPREGADEYSLDNCWEVDMRVRLVHRDPSTFDYTDVNAIADRLLESLDVAPMGARVYDNVPDARLVQEDWSTGLVQTRRFRNVRRVKSPLGVGSPCTVRVMCYFGDSSHCALPRFRKLTTVQLDSVAARAAATPAPTAAATAAPTDAPTAAPTSARRLADLDASSPDVDSDLELVAERREASRRTADGDARETGILSDLETMSERRAARQLADGDALGTDFLSDLELARQPARGEALAPLGLASDLDARAELGAPGRALAVKLIDVTIVWGLRAPKTTPLVGPIDLSWTFDPTFEPDNPWAQRSMYAMCVDMPDRLRVVDSQCWVTRFRDYQRSRGKRFPTRKFHTDLSDWLKSDGEESNNLWMLNGKVMACKANFRVNVRASASVETALKHQSYWDDWVNSVNEAASVTANKAYHSSGAWVRAEAQLAIVSSTRDTILIEFLCSFIGLVIFTGGPRIAILVLGLLIINIAGLAFFMIVWMGWAMGPIEIIFLVVFLGYSVTFGLHTGHNYSQALPNDPRWDEVLQMTSKNPAEPDAKELRAARTRIAVLHVGGAILSSAVSTIGSSFFLFMCTLTMFAKLGLIVITVTVLSSFFTLIALPAVLMLFGPPLENCHRRLLKVYKRFAPNIRFFNVKRFEERAMDVPLCSATT